MAYEPGKKLTARLAEVTGRFKCTNCQRMKEIKGGKTIIASNGTKRWKCAFCLSQRIAPTVGTQGVDSTGGGVSSKAR